MPTEHPTCREADSVRSNPGVEAPWIEPASRSAKREPDTASLYQLRSASLSELPKPEIRREVMFTCSGGDLRGARGSAQGRFGWAGWETLAAGLVKSEMRRSSKP